MPMFRDGITDVNAADAAAITKAKDDIASIAEMVGNISFDHDDYTDVPEGKAYLHQSWSGNASDAVVFLADKSDADVLSYYWPGSDGHPANVDNDTIVLLSSGKNPVLAHLLANYLLDNKNALANFTNMTGYQMPVQAMTPESMVSSGIVPEAPVDRDRQRGRLREGFSGAGAPARPRRAVAVRVRRTAGGCLAAAPR